MLNSFPPDLAAFVQSEVALGKYPTEDAVVEAAVRLLKEQEAHTEFLRREIQLGLDEIERGELTTYDQDTLPELIDEIKRQGRKRLEAEQSARR